MIKIEKLDLVPFSMRQIEFQRASAVFKSEGFYFVKSSGKCGIDTETKVQKGMDYYLIPPC